MFGLWRRLSHAGVLGINRRNARYTLAYNPRHLYPLVDDKLRTKALAQAAGIDVPELYAVVRIEREVHQLVERLAPYPEFVIKPARGSGGNGILVITGRSREHFRKVGGSLITRRELEHHVSNILSGMYSLGGHPDQAIVEYRIRFDPLFDAVAYQGVPDIRIVVLLGVPVMAMVRLPTRQSGGRANLHQGALGAGIDIASGITLGAVQKNALIREHPDTGNSISGLAIPHWEQLLGLASRCYELTGLGYQGVDIVLDRDKGPMMLEINARPGLNIQIANHCGLLPRLRQVERQAQRLHTVEARLAFARTHFRAQ